MSLHIGQHGTHFVCKRTNRILQLRGVSLSGSSKLPKDLPSHSTDKDAFFDSANVSYIGRPFPLDEMDDHLSRIRDWGFRVIRLVVTWEALEHAGWRQYDHAFMEYIATIVKALPQYGLSCIIDAHQDVFSRLTGGSGAPGWVLPIIGLSQATIHAAHAAHLHPLALLSSDPPPSVWPTGYQKLAAATCNTVFWAGDIFAWKRKAPDGSGRGLSTFFQDAMCDAYAELAKHLDGLEAVLGFEPMNEPHRGYLELYSMYTFDSNTDLQLGYHANALESFALSDGYSLSIPYYVPSFPEPTRISRYEIVNQAGERAWAKDKPCIWREHGVWEWDEKSQRPLPLRESYFTRDPRTGKAFEWYKDCWYPFLQKFQARIAGDSQTRQGWMTFAAGIPNEYTPPWPKELQPPNFVSAPHWYDLHSLFTKSFGNITFNVQSLSRGVFPLSCIHLGREGVRNNYSKQIANIVQASDRSTGRPCIIGEVGVPFDQNNRRAFTTKDLRWQERQMDALCTAMERSLVSYILWNYNPENEDQYGDAWYGENFSLYSLSVQEGGKNGAGRCVDAFQRPYAIATAGMPVETHFDMFNLDFTYRYRNFDSNDSRSAPKTKTTELYLPVRRYGKAIAEGSMQVTVTDGEWTYDQERQILYWTHDDESPGTLHTLSVKVHDSKLHKYKPLDVDLKESPLRWVLAAIIAIFALVWRIVVS